MTQPAAPPGWYPDGQGATRYWDGTIWTNAPAPVASPQTYAPPPSYSQPQPPKQSHTLRNVLLALVALIGVGAVIGAIATGGKKSNNNISTTPLTQINTDLPAAGNAAPTTAAPQTVADVGSTITVAGSRSDQLDVTLVAVKPVVATDNFSTPPAGDVFVGAQFLLVNTGSTAFSDAIDNDAVLSDAAGNQFKTDIVESINAGTLFQTPTNIAVGGKALGWIVFDVPKGAVVTQAQFTLDSGTGDSGQWNVP